MATTQYVGARYVPLFADPAEWSNANAYEPLTIVVHEGNSYTSKMAVPKGVDISNEKYWALTGNYNAQVEEYRKEVKTFGTQIDDNTAAIKAETTRAESAETSLVEKIEKEIEDREYQDNVLTAALTVEETARKEGDTQLDTKISTETTRAKNSENNLEDLINETNSNFRTLISAYVGYKKFGSYDSNDCVIAGSNDGINWGMIRTIDLKSTMNRTADSVNICAIDSKDIYILNASVGNLVLNKNFEPVKATTFNLGSEYVYWAPSFMYDEDTDKLYWLSCRTTGNNKETNYVGNNTYSDMQLCWAECTINSDYTLSLGAITNIALNDSPKSVIDVHIIKHNGTLYLTCKDELECCLYVYSGSSLSSPFTHIWTNPTLRGIESPKLTAYKNNLYVYFAAYSPTVVDNRISSESKTITLNGVSLTAAVLTGSTYFGNKPLYEGRYCIDLSTYNTKEYVIPNRFDYSVPRHMGLTSTKHGFITPGATNGHMFINSKETGCNTEMGENLIKLSTSPTNNNVAFLIPAVGNETIVTMIGTVTSTMKVFIIFVPVGETSGFGSLHISFSMASGGSLYIGRRSLNGEYYVPAHTSLNSVVYDRYTYTNVMGYDSYANGWTSMGPVG